MAASYPIPCRTNPSRVSRKSRSAVPVSPRPTAIFSSSWRRTQVSPKGDALRPSFRTLSSSSIDLRPSHRLVRPLHQVLERPTLGGHLSQCWKPGDQQVGGMKMSSPKHDTHPVGQDPRFPKVLVNPRQMKEWVPGIPDERLKEAEEVASQYTFRVPDFYARNVLNGPDDPLLDLVLPSSDEYLDGEEKWDATPSPYLASRSPFWVQKYEYQGLVRTTSYCSGICRFCYLKNKNEARAVMRPADVHALFDDLENKGERLREVILSGGDPLAAPLETLATIADRLSRLREKFGSSFPHAVIHTREPVWDPVRLLNQRRLWEVLGQIGPKAIMLHVIHPREVTPEFIEICERFAELGPTSRPALLCQHPVFRGVNDSTAILEELYSKLTSICPPVLPYYFVYPFYNGTLSRHRISLEAAQGIFRELVRNPGWFVPRMVIPTPWGKCLIGPHEHFKRQGNAYELTTKDGVRVSYDDASLEMHRIS
jgi:L-lysine 2,3-aminomutase